MKASKTTKSKATQAPQKGDSEQSSEPRFLDEHGRIAKGSTPPNGLGERPEARSNGTWDRSGSISHWYNYFIRLSASEVKTWKDRTPEAERTMAQEIAWQRAYEARKSGRLGLDNTREITDRTEGKAPQVVTNNIRRSPLDGLELSKEELMAIAFGSENITGSINYDGETPEGSQNDGSVPTDDED